MNLERIRERLRAGFRPFAIKVSDGSQYEVPHPEFVAVGRGVVVVMRQNDSIRTIDGLHIIALEELPRTESGPSA